jgi:hypothetical protein
MDFEKELAGIVATIPPGHEPAREAVQIAAQALDEIDHDYGPGSDNPLYYHHAPHSLGSIRRGVRIATLLLPYMKPRYRPRIYDATIVTEATHDRYQLFGPGLNELASTGYAFEAIEAVGGVLNTKTFKKRVEYGHQATVIESQEDGTMTQVNLRRGAKDPIKIIAAYGDTGGIGMEGKKLMVRNAIDLYHERCALDGEKPSNAGRREFMSSGEVAFIRDQFSENQVKATLAFYFPNDVETIYRQARRQFHGNIVASFRLAEKLGYYPELEIPIGRIVETIDPSQAGAAISKLILRKIGRRSD